MAALTLDREKGRYSQGGVVDEVFEVDAAAVLCEVSETAVTHWNNKWKSY